MESDPTPGDPDEVRILADSLQTFADDVGEALGRVRGMAEDRAVMDWAGLSAEAFRSEFDGVPGNLQKLQTSYGMAAQALQTYWPKLETAQGMADRALDRAIAAQADLSTAQAALSDAQDWVSRAGEEAERLEREGERDDVEPPSEAEVRSATRDANAAQSAATSARSRVDNAEQALSAARELAQQAKQMREDAARVCADEIDEASDAGIQNRRWWEDAVHWVSENWDTIVEVCKVVVAVLGIVVMIIGGPLAWVVLAAALVVMADTLHRYANGQASLWDVAFAALDCIPGMKGLTTLGGLAVGIRASATTGLRGMRQGVRGLGQSVRRMGRGGDNLVCRTDPIDMATGEMVMDVVDVELPGVLPLVIRRHHRTSLKGGTWFGRSWTSTLDQRLILDEAGLRFVTADGMVLDYPRPLADEPVLPVEGPRWGLAWEGEPGGPLTVHQPDTGQILHFAPVPGRRGGELPLVAVTDHNANRIDIRYDETGALTDVVHDGGYHLGITTADGRVTELRLLNDPGRPVLRRYGYDERGNVSEVFNSSGLPLKLSYDEKRRVTGWEDRNGTWYRYTYDDDGRCVATDGTDGYLASRIVYDTDSRRTLFTDSLGHTTVYQFNDSYQLVTETDAFGHHTHRTYDRYDRPLTITDPLGRVTTFAYDEHGHLIDVTRPDSRHITLEHNAAGQVTAVVEADGTVWRQEYDDRGNLTTVTDPAGATTRHTYDDGGRIVSVTDPLGGTTRYETDGAGLPLRIVGPLGGAVGYRRDAFGRPIEITDPLGAVHRMEWTVEGSPLRRTDPLGGIQSWTWDAEGNCLSHTGADGHTVHYEYGAFDLPTVEIRPDGARYRFAHDTELRVTQVTNPTGLTWTYRHDAAGRVTSETDFDGRTLRYTHDAAGQLTSRTNALGQTVTFTYDLNGLATEKNADGRRTTFTFDAAGRVLTATGPDAHVGYERDVLGRVLGETVNGATVRHSYDVHGNPVSRTTPAGHHTTYLRDVGGAPVTITSAGRPMRFERDTGGRDIRRVIGHGPGIDLAQEWDESGRVTVQSVTTSARPPRLRTYHYLPGRHLAAIDDSRFGAAEFSHDSEGRVTGVQAAGWVESYRYDGAGNQTMAEWPGEAHDLTATGERDYTGLRVTRAGGFHYEHDADGRVVLRRRKTLSGRTDTWRYTWDAEDRLTDVVTPDGTCWHYRYDPFGRRIAKQRLAADGSVAGQTDYVWSGMQLVEQSTADHTITWDYDQLRPLAQTERHGAGPHDDVDARFYAIVTDLVGAPTELIDEAGETVWQARATLWGAGAAPGGTPLRFPGQYADPETGWYYNVLRHYDPATARYTTPDPLGLAPAPNPVAYVPHPQELADPLGLAPCRPTPYRPRMPWGRPDGQLVFSGHGVFHQRRLFQRSFVVPEGTSIAFYSHHGEALNGPVGNAVELGQNVGVFDRGRFLGVAQPIPVRVYGPGERVPNYTLHPPTPDLGIQGDPFTVSSQTRLSDLVQPNLGQVHWAACTSTSWR